MHCRVAKNFSLAGQWPVFSKNSSEFEWDYRTRSMNKQIILGIAVLSTLYRFVVFPMETLLKNVADCL